MKCPIGEGWMVSDIEAAISRNEPNELLWVPICVSMDPLGRIWSERVCIRLSTHSHSTVRANAILAFGHLARTFGYLNRRLIQPIIESGLAESDVEVRGNSYSATDDVEWYLGWVLAGREDKRGKPRCPGY